MRTRRTERYTYDIASADRFTYTTYGNEKQKRCGCNRHGVF